MKAFSVRAPWWWFILHAGKDVENRGRRISFGGRRVIHASAWWNECEVMAEIGRARKMVPGLAQMTAIDFDRMRALRGHLVGSVELYGCVDASRSPWFVGPYGWLLREPRVLRAPVRFTGALGFFEVPEGLE